MNLNLFQVGDRVINLNAVTYIHYTEGENGQYCQLCFGTATHSTVILRGDQARSFWALARHLAMDITPKPEKDPKPDP